MGAYFIIAVYASFVVRPRVIHADGSLRLLYGALLDIRIPAQDITAAPRRAQTSMPWHRSAATMT
jgi:hypothetical protein